MSYGQILVMTLGVIAFCFLPAAGQERGTAATLTPSPESAADPFTGIAPTPAPAAPPVKQSWVDRFFADNFGFRKELMAEFGVNDEGSLASRLSVGFELLKKFSTKTRTFAARL